MANVTGPVSSTDTAIARWNGTSGTVIQDSGVTIDGSNNIAGLNSISSDGGDFTSDGSGNVTLASLTGSPTTTTQSSGDNSTKIATTAYVDSGLAGLALGSLSDCITDYSNTNMFLGQGSGAAGTSGDENTCLGIDVLAAATSGGANTAVGFYALKNSINGTGNTAIGSEAAIGLTSGQNNVVIGADTFSSATSASGTVCIGFQAGDSLTIGTDNVVIGYGADIASGASNSIAIGCDAVASSANTVQIGNSSVTSVYLGGSGATLGTSLALAGNPTTTTQSSGDNSTKIATTAFVQAALPGLATTSVAGIVQPDGATIDVSGGVISVPTATTSLLGLVKPDGATIDVSSGTISVPTATTSLKGLVKPDGATINVSSGVISVPTATTGLLGLVKPDGATIDVSSGVISVPTATTSTLGLVKTDGSTLTNSSGAIAVATATTSQLGAVKPDGATIDVSSGVISVPTATTSLLGLVKPDGVTVGISSGVISTLNAGQFCGFINKFRNPKFDIAQRGDTGFTGLSYGPDGWLVVGVGEPVTWNIIQSTTFGGIYSAYLEVTGSLSTTAAGIAQRIESMEAAQLAGQTVTVQFYFYNGLPTSVAPQISTAYPSGLDNWTSQTTDLSATNMQTIASGNGGVCAYTFNVSANAYLGYYVNISIPTTNGETWKISGLDIRVTPGGTTGLNSSPPTPEFLPVALELARCQRYFCTSFGKLGGAGFATTAGLQFIGALTTSSDYAGSTIDFPVQMRAAPTITYYDGNDDQGTTSYLTATTWTHNSSPTNSHIPLVTSTTGFLSDIENTTGASKSYFIHYLASAEL